jgi:hypothetical protein
MMNAHRTGTALAAVAPSFPAASMRIHVGTSGYRYKQWRGRFYPGDQ